MFTIACITIISASPITKYEGNLDLHLLAIFIDCHISSRYRNITPNRPKTPVSSMMMA